MSFLENDEKKEPIIEEPDELQAQLYDGLKAPSLDDELQALSLHKNYVVKVRRENQETYDEIVKSLNVIPNLEVVRNEPTILPIANGLQNGCVILMDVRRKIRENCQFISALSSYKPAILNHKSESLWNSIDKGHELIYQNAMGLMKVNTQFLSHFIKIQDSLGRFIKLNEKGADFNESTVWLKKDMNDFNKFRVEFEDKVKTLSEAAFDTLVDSTRNMKGHVAIETALKKVRITYNEYLNALQKVHSLEEDRRKEVFAMELKKAEAEGKNIRAQVESQFANGHISNKQEALNLAKEKTEQLRLSHSNASNYSLQEASSTNNNWTRTFLWWGHWETTTDHYYLSVYTGEKDRIKADLDDWMIETSKAKSKLDTEETKKARLQQLVEQTEMEVKELKKYIEDLHTSWRKKLTSQNDQVQKLKNEYDRIHKEIQEFIESIQIDEGSIIDFLRLTSQIPNRALIANDVSTGIGEFIRLFEDLLSRRVNVDLTIDPKAPIDEIFKEKQLESLIEPFKDESLFTMNDIRFDSEDEYKEFEEMLKDKGILLKIGERKKLKELCIKSVIQDKEKEIRAKQILNEEVGSLQQFFIAIHDPLVKGCRKLEIVSLQDTVQVLALNN